MLASSLLTATALALLQVSAPAGAHPAHGRCAAVNEGFQPSAAYHWMDVMLEAAAADVQSYGARPTVLSRQMAIVQTAVFDAWAAYDDTAVGTRYGGALRRPEAERTLENKRIAIAHAS